MDWKLSLAGLLIGLLVGMTGMGGGSLMTPMLILVFGFKPTVAIGTDILHGAIAVGGIFMSMRPFDLPESFDAHGCLTLCERRHLPCVNLCPDPFTSRHREALDIARGPNRIIKSL